jgi:hypothetical protein
VQRNGEFPLVGEIDELTHDASVFWVWLEGGRGRIAVYTDEGTSVWTLKGSQLNAAITGDPVLKADQDLSGP